MKRILTILLVMFTAISCSAEIIKVVVKPGSDSFAEKEIRLEQIPEEFREYTETDGKYTVTVYEYKDVIIIERKPDPVLAGVYIAINNTGLGGKTDNVLYAKLSNDKESRDRMYEINEKNHIVLALRTSFRRSPAFREEFLAIDKYDTEQINGKPLIIRQVVPVKFYQSLNVLKNKTAVPERVSLLSDNIVRLVYNDGAIEHWVVAPGSVDMAKNIKKYADRDQKASRLHMMRALIWWNKKGEGCGDHEKYKAWNYNEDPSNEPVYKSEAKETAPEVYAKTSNRGNIFSGMLARIKSFFKGLFGSQAV